MDHAFLVRVLNRTAHREKHFQPLADCHSPAVAVLRYGHALDVLHDEVRPALRCGACVEYPRDTRVVHDRQCLAFICKTGQYLTGIHSELYNFERYKTANRFALLGEVHGSHTAFAKRSKDMITAEVVIRDSWRHCVDGFNSGVVAAKRTLEHALHQALGAQSRGIIRTQSRSALRAVRHLGYICSASF